MAVARNGVRLGYDSTVGFSLDVRLRELDHPYVGWFGEIKFISKIQQLELILSILPFRLTGKNQRCVLLYW